MSALQARINEINAMREIDRNIAKIRQEYVNPLTRDHLAIESYNPAALVDALIDRMHLKNDAALARALEVAPPTISKLRHRDSSLHASLILRMHDVTELPVREIRRLAGL